MIIPSVCRKFSYKMKYASIILDVFHRISLFITSSFSFVFAIWKWKKMNQSTLLFTNLWRHLAHIWLAIWSQVVISISIACRRYLGWVFPLKFSSACGTGTAWKVELSSTLPVPQADCRRYLGQAFPLKKICLGHVPGSAPDTTAGTAGSFTVIWEPGFRWPSMGVPPLRVEGLIVKADVSVQSQLIKLETSGRFGLFKLWF